MAKFMSNNVRAAALASDAEFEVYCDALEEQAAMTSSASDPEMTLADISDMLAGRRAVPFCVNVSAFTAAQMRHGLLLAA